MTSQPGFGFWLACLIISFWTTLPTKAANAQQFLAPVPALPSVRSYVAQRVPQPR